MVINCKALNDALLPIRYPMPTKEALFQKISNNNVFNKFDLKSGLCQIGVIPSDRYNTGFVVPHGQFQRRVMPFRWKNAHFEFHKRMEDIFGDLKFFIVYIGDMLSCSFDLKEHRKNLEIVHYRIFKHGLVLKKPKLEFAKTRIEYLELIPFQGKVEL